MLEAIMAIALMAILAAIVVPILVTVDNTQRVTSSFVVMNAIAFAEANFHTAVTQYPGRISHLGTQVLSTDTTDCSGIAPSNAAVTYGNNQSKWINGGPFYYRAVSKAGGLPIGIGVINDQMLRTSNNTTAGTLDMVVPAVRLEDAEELNALQDGAAEANNADQSNTLGVVQWAAPDAANLVTVHFRVPVNNKC